MAGKKDTNGKSHSEIATNILIGYTIANIINLTILPHFSEGIANQDIVTSIIISAIFTVTSYIRGFSIRRLFERMKYNFTLLSILKAIRQKFISL